MTGLERFTVETFEGRIGEGFSVGFDPAEPTALELVEVTRLAESAEGRRIPFSLVFRAEPHRPHPQRIYPVEHAELGSFEIFLVPLAPDERGALYEAVFS